MKNELVFDANEQTVKEWKKSHMFGFELLRETVMDNPALEHFSPLYKYAPEAQMRILAKLKELESAIQDAAIVHKNPTVRRGVVFAVDRFKAKRKVA